MRRTGRRRTACPRSRRRIRRHSARARLVGEHVLVVEGLQGRRIETELPLEAAGLEAATHARVQQRVLDARVTGFRAK